MKNEKLYEKNEKKVYDIQYEILAFHNIVRM